MEKKIARIYRWLERCAKACSAGSWSSALLDMECAKAELEDVRSEIWSRAEGTLQGRSASTRKNALVLRVSCLSIVLLFAFAAPLAMQSARPASHSLHERADALIHSGEPVLEWVTGDEQALLAALRKSLSEANRAWSAAALLGESDVGRSEVVIPAVSEVRSATARAGASERSSAGEVSAGSAVRVIRPKDAGARGDRPAGENPVRLPSAENELDSIISLVQIGRTALRGERVADTVPEPVNSRPGSSGVVLNFCFSSISG